MKIVDTVPHFLDNYQPSINFLRSYYSKFSDIFKEYFLYHCKDTEERHYQSIQRYPQVFNAIQLIHQKIVPLINEVEKNYSNLYDVTFPIDVNLIVGGFGSNAYTYRQIIPNVTFALERLSPESIHLKVIIAHEFGHLTHNILSKEAGNDWSKVDWNSPLTWLFQEGVATHFSRKTVPGLSPSIYFSYDDSGDEWLQFASLHKQEIKYEFGKALKNCTPLEMFREWFSINGGSKFGYSRLGYFLGDLLFQELVLQVGEKKAIVAWPYHGFEKRINGWL
ncbi:hypothetical protein [Ureibacillus manganicus]|uniref:DUF2268 domain-containing protein n=1 Tax=Ureibacillus manganicus DSM 26584 TaxID=1384049 RepID=A0A0A3HVM6_9BACL|nr:hypothetical protein [Ureibacillus manganicus]KGR74348.1 hypothetical protein CD29_18690 [Ureibacillus manganicus DSM 26584]